MTADLEFGTSDDHGTAPRPGQGDRATGGPGAVGAPDRAAGRAEQPMRGPAMRGYCAALARFTSSVQSTEQLLRNDDAGTREDTEQRELTSTSRLRGIERAAHAADDGLDHGASVRSAHGLPLRASSWGTDDDSPTAAAEAEGTALDGGLDRLRRAAGGADLGVALTSLGRRRDALRLAEEEFTGWLAARDQQTRRICLGAAVGAGLAGSAVMAVAGSRLSAALSLALLVLCTLAVVAVGVGVAAARRSPRVCRGAGLARRPHPLGLARYAAQVGGLALLALAAANIGAGAL
ncbi:hypothetical protein [Jiangella mangrovi]|uniref:Uncharacterized protein n=1 Tax=Jiangella mangrovi TaxID=1524084 RepID=A0A7W9GP83_9ACTN|nr:hypothetical protein [Jiangella mangrovi]MBB5787176.1 hypothetical protein [Jiangella mangrovi]